MVKEFCQPPEQEQRAVSTVTATTHVADLVRADPSRARVFERLGIDYCCGGNTPLQDACSDLGLDQKDVIALLEEPRGAGAEDIDWEAATIPELVDHIVDVHHTYLRAELEPLGVLVAKVAHAHGALHPELIDVKVAYAAVALELHEHMPKEEVVLFPACVALAGDDGPERRIDAPVQAMLDDHQEVANGLARLRRLTNGYTVPHWACASYRSMLDRLATLEADIHRHVHEENNILFPRALELAASRRRR